MNKQHILDEIRRTAAENGGAPLGIDRFATETGIRVSDWDGKFWARWGDAVREAGYEPNRLTGPIDEEDVFEGYAALARELGGLPVRSEWELKRRTDSLLPGVKIVTRRFGGKPAFVERLLRYCESRGGLDDVIGFCRDYLISNGAHNEEATREQQKLDIGFVYLLKFGRHYKIGRCNSVGRRLYELDLQLPERAKLVHSIQTDDPAGIEAYWHRRFELKRKNGEWFELDAVDVNAFRRRKFM